MKKTRKLLSIFVEYIKKYESEFLEEVENRDGNLIEMLEETEIEISGTDNSVIQGIEDRVNQLTGYSKANTKANEKLLSEITDLKQKVEQEVAPVQKAKTSSPIKEVYSSKVGDYTYVVWLLDNGEYRVAKINGVKVVDYLDMTEEPQTLSSAVQQLEQK